MKTLSGLQTMRSVTLAWTPDLSGRNRVKYLALVEAIADAVAAGDLKPVTACLLIGIWRGG